MFTIQRVFGGNGFQAPVFLFGSFSTQTEAEEYLAANGWRQIHWDFVWNIVPIWVKNTELPDVLNESEVRRAKVLCFVSEVKEASELKL